MHPFYRLIVFLFLCVGIAFTCLGQSYYFKHYQVDDGLSHNAVTCILQDSKGLIWIGTRGGLNSFDGYNFKTVTNNETKLGNIANNVITAIAEDRKGLLWIATGKGLFRYDRYKEALTLLTIAPQSYIQSLLIDPDDNLWFLADYSLYRYNPKTNKLDEPNIHGNCLAIDAQKNIWVGNDRGVIEMYTPHNRLRKSVRIIDAKVPVNRRSISKIAPQQDGLILVGCFKQGLKSYDPQSGTVRSLRLSNEVNAEIYVRDIAAVSRQECWVGTESGIYIYNKQTDTSYRIRKRFGDPYSLADNAVYAISKDNQGGMWVGTFFGGLNYYSKENARFEKYYPQVGTNAISGNAVREICSDNKGNLWIGTEDAGLNKLDLNTGLFTNYKVSNNAQNISYPNIHGLLAVGNQLYIGPFFHGLEIMDISTGKVTDRFKFIGNKNDNASDFIHSIHLTQDSTLLLGTAYNASGLFSYNRKQKTFSRIKQVPYGTYVFHIAEDSDGTIWTGSASAGAYYYNPKTGVSGNIHFGTRLKNGQYANEFAVRYIKQDSNHNMWFATEGGGLVKYNPSKKTFKKFTTKDGLLSDVIFCILEDNLKHLWVSSLKGLICLDLKTEKFQTFTQSNGLITDQFNYNSAYKDQNGRLYFGSVKGMIAFNPAEFAPTSASPPTYITGFQINNKEIVPDDKGGPLTRSILFTDTIVLTHNQNSFSIEFAALNYSSPKVTRYKYLMKGLDKYWTYLKTNRKAYFTDLTAGDYTFIVKAESNTGNWAGTERRLFIRVLPPFWKSPVAYFIYLVTFIFFLYLSVVYYHRYIERKSMNRLQLFEHQKEKEIYEAKIEFFTNIAHEIQTPLTLIVGPVELLIEKTEEHTGIKKSLMMVKKNAKRLSELTTQLLDFRKTEMHQFGLNFVNTDITRLLHEQVSVFRLEAEKSHIKLDIHAPKEHVVAFVDREAMIKICSNLISNAIKYATTSASIHLAALNAQDEHFVIRVSNDGRGIPKEFTQKIFEPFFRIRGHDKPGTGIGLSLAKSLAELHNGSLKLAQSDHTHTVFELSLPVHQKFEFKLSSWKKID
jgi:signal transduction histidine kinase/ligand-binding sensor domain-containing protein